MAAKTPPGILVRRVIRIMFECAACCLRLAQRPIISSFQWWLAHAVEDHHPPACEPTAEHDDAGPAARHHHISFVRILRSNVCPALGGYLMSGSSAALW